MDQSQPNASAIIELLASHEDTISLLYRAYAERFPEFAEFWSGLAGQEASHAGWIRGLAARLGQGSVFFRERFKLEPLQISLEYMLAELERAREQDVSMSLALARAMQIEEALIEKRYFEVFEGDSVELSHALQNLDRDTREHVSQIKKQREYI